MIDAKQKAMARLEAKQAELMSDLMDLVEVGELTAQEANEWANDKADQWNSEIDGWE